MTYEYNPEFADELGQALDALTGLVNRINQANGWFDDDRRFGEECMLLDSEVAEAFEEFRAGRMTTTFEAPANLVFEAGGQQAALDALAERGLLPKPVGMPSELADILIRLCDTAGRYGVDLAHETLQKLAFNATRGYKHGGKAI